MTKIFQKALLLLFLPLASLTTMSHAQDIPAVTGPVSLGGFQLPDTLGALNYAVSATETVTTGFYGNSTSWTTDLSGDIGYLSKSEARPFSMVYSGGYIHNTKGEPNSTFQNLSLSQSFMTRAWTLNLSNAISYLPEAPASGLSGIPGLGDLGTGPVQLDPGTGSEILSRYGQRIANTSTVTLTRNLTGSTSIRGSGSYFLQDFLDNFTGLDNNNLSGQGGVNHRIDALSSATVTYSYSNFSYPASNFTFITQGVTIGYTRSWSRLLSSDISIGPQRTSTPTSAFGGGSTYNFSADGNLSYTGEQTNYSIRYIHGVSGGSGVIPGTVLDSLNFIINHSLGRLLHANATTGYSSHKTIPVLSTTPISYKTFIANVEVSREVAENLSAYVSYTALLQDTSNVALGINGFNGLSQTVGFGITYSPRALHLGHQ